MIEHSESNNLRNSAMRVAYSNIGGIPIPVLFCIFMAIASGAFVSVMLPVDQKAEVRAPAPAAIGGRLGVFTPAVSTPENAPPLRRDPAQKSPG